MTAAPAAPKPARVIAVCVGRAEPIGPARRAPVSETQPDGVRSAIRKQAVSTLHDPVRVELAPTGLWGDEQADLRVHGGPDKAVYAYAAEDTAWWAEELGRELGPGAFGENLTVARIDVSGAVIGERWTVDSTELEVAQPRFPCAKLGMRFGEQRILKRFG